MLQVDTIIIGMGLAGCSMYWSLKKAGLSCLCIDPNLQQTSSLVAAGMFNPIIGKRFTTVANAQEIFDSAKKYYKAIEEMSSIKLYHEIPLYMPFQNIAHQNDWSLKLERLKEWVHDDPALDQLLTVNYQSEYGGFFVNKTGYLDSNLYVNTTLEYCKKNSELLVERIDYEKLNVNDKIYNNYQAKYIIFCEGSKAGSNPFVKQEFLNSAKGQLLWGQASSSIPQIIYNGKIYIVPTANNQFICGATYEWVYIDDEPNEFGKEYLIHELNKVLKYDYTIIDHKAAVRPTVIDRKPVVGNFDPENKELYILNGLGTKGVILAPHLANLITENIVNNKEIPTEYSIYRFTL
ncbi:MAG: FAD-dependent oxidoreductase [Bacteroidota bacterium]|nr:FAD-dependent oxidoreductase [Bacteroidota bacterium]